MSTRTRALWQRFSVATTAALIGSMSMMACNDTKEDYDGNTDPNDKVAYEPTDCDPIDPSMCALPFPSNLYLKDDASTATGLALRYGETTLPKGRRAIKPDAWNGLDGYGVSSPILFSAPNLDMTDLPHEENARSSWDGEIGQAQLFEVQSDGALKRVPFFAERDPRTSADKSVYFLRPLVILEEDTRYIVMLRNLKDTDGNALKRSDAFEKLVQNKGYQDAELSGRQDAFNAIFDALEKEGIERNELYLAWDFHTASHEALHGPMLQGRDLVLQALDGGGPAMTITDSTVWQRDDPSDHSTYNPFWNYEFHGTFAAPQIIKPDGSLGMVFNTDDDGNLQIFDTVEREFWVRIPYEVIENPQNPIQMIQYGHGLLGKGNQVRGEAFGHSSGKYNNIYFGSNWTGMSSPDEVRVGAVVNDFSNFRWLSDTMHQGILEFLILAEGMKHTFPTIEGLEDKDGNALDLNLNTEEILYHGISQGGIYGATYVAVSPDINVGALGVPGVNYNFLVQRSVDFDKPDDPTSFMNLALSAYDNDPNKIAVILAAVQSLWDMTDPASYYKHLSKAPFPGNAPKKVLLQPAKGDHQVSPLTNIIVANSNVGVKIMKGWGVDITHFGPGLAEQDFGSGSDAYKGSGVVLWDFGNPWPAPGMVPPDEPKELDPHGIPRFVHIHQDQMMHFLENDGEIIDVCEGKGCRMEMLSTEGEPSACDTYKVNELGVPAASDDRQCYVLID